MVDHGIQKPLDVLFIGCLYCDCKPEHGHTNAEHYLWGSLEKSGLSKRIRKFHFDDYFFKNKEKGDRAFLKEFEEKPDLVFLDWQCGSEYNPGIRTLLEIKKAKVPIVAIWWDHVWGGQIGIADDLKDVVDLNVVVDSGSFYPRTAVPNKYIFLWTPEHPDLYFWPEKKDIPLSFIGRSVKKGRKEAILELQKIPGFYHDGGQREHRLSVEEYASLYRRSKIAISFSASKSGFGQVVGHVFEATLSGCLLLDQANVESRGMFIPGVDFVEWSTIEDLIEKSKYYLAHDEEREAIARRGYEKARKNYSSWSWWNTVLRNVG